MNIQDIISVVKSEDKRLLNFFKFNYPVFHNSNVFFRDFHYCIKSYLESKQISITYGDAEKVARELVKHFERESVFVPINSITWRLDYVDFKTGSEAPVELTNS